jgi:hypothetical protein
MPRLFLSRSIEDGKRPGPVDVGSLHIFALSTQKPTGAEMEWLIADLTAATQPARRQEVPWYTSSPTWHPGNRTPS